MRLTAIFLIIGLSAVHSNVLAQRITFSKKNVPLSKVFSAIQKQSGISFIYDNKLIRQAKKIDINFKNTTLEEAMQYCLKDLPLEYILSDGIIIIREKEKVATSNNALLFQDISGSVLDENGLALHGATVLIKELKNGAQTDSAGKYNFSHLPSGTYTVQVSFVSYTTLNKKITIPASNEQLVFTLKRNERNLAEVAVTALGINRNVRTLTYSTQSISGDELSAVKTGNILNNLNGKIAGMSINRTAGGVGGSVRVVIRGDKSTRNSQPLYVIDGMPIINPIGGPTSGLYNQAPDPGDILSTINPDDVESVNILKGASASALYGSQGSNGVVLITTKKGKAGFSKIDFSSSVTFDKVLILPKLQYKYGQSTVGDANQPGSEDSWGATLTNNTNENYLDDFFQTGINFINSIKLSTGKENSSNYLSYSNTENKGILPTSTFRQHTISFRQTGKFIDNKLLLDATVFGAIQQIHNRHTPGVYSNPLTGLYLFPRGIDFNAFKTFEYFSPSRYLYAQNWWNINHDKNLANGGGWGGQDYQQNPYWILNRNTADNCNKNIYASVLLKYHVAKSLDLQVRGNINNFLSDFQRNAYATTQATLAGFNGNIRSNKSNTTTFYGDAILMGDKELGKGYALSYILGGSIQDQKMKSIAYNGTPSIPNVFIESALERTNIDIRNNALSRQIQSVFSSIQLNFKNKWFVDVTDRNDWSSTLAFTPTVSKGYNYYSVGTSAIISDMIPMPSGINFAKFRISYALVGNDIAPFSTYPLYTFNAGGIALSPSSTSINIPGYYLRPEKNTSLEVGMQWKLFGNRLSFDFTWYKSNIINQYFRGIAVPPGLGTGGFADINSGNIQNSGLELFGSYKLVNTTKTKWTTTINFSNNKNRIVQLLNSQIVVNPSPEQIYLLDGGSGGNDGLLKKGGAYGDIYGRMFERDEKGRMIINSTNGLPYLIDRGFLGNPNPKFVLSVANNISYKNIAVNFLIDGKFGGIVLSKTEGYLDQMGVSKKSADVRDDGGQISFIDAVDETGAAWTKTIDAQTYYKSIGGKTSLDEAYTYKATAMRLRELSITYRIPVKNKFIASAEVSVIGSNLFFIYRKAPFDPEQVAGVNPGGVGVDTFGLPAYKSVGLSFRCTF